MRTSTTRLVSALLALVAGAGAEPLDEATAILTGLERPALTDLVEGTVGVAEADVRAARTWQDPSLVYTFEEAKGGAPGSADEGIAALQQSFEPEGRRRLRVRAARQRVEAARGLADSRRVDQEALIRRRFFELLEVQVRLGALQTWDEGLATALGPTVTRPGAVLGERRAKGRRYQVKRLARERSLVAAEVQKQGGARARRAARLAATLGLDGGLDEVVGTLAPLDPPPLDELLGTLSRRPGLRELRARRDAARTDVEVARRFPIPAVQVGMGRKEVRSGGDELNGWVAFASIPLPLLDGQRPARRKAAAEAQRAQGELALAELEARGEVQGLWEEARRLARAAREFRQRALGPREDLLAEAEEAFREDALGIVGLLDAHRSTYEVRNQAIDLDARARAARIALDRATGGFLRGAPAGR